MPQFRRWYTASAGRRDLPGGMGTLGGWNWGWNDVRNSDGRSFAATSPHRMVGQGRAAVRRAGLRLWRGRLDQRIVLVHVARLLADRARAAIFRGAFFPG